MVNVRTYINKQFNHNIIYCLNNNNNYYYYCN